jgi:hypothetical protein
MHILNSLSLLSVFRFHSLHVLSFCTVRTSLSLPYFRRCDVALRDVLMLLVNAVCTAGVVLHPETRLVGFPPLDDL